MGHLVYVPAVQRLRWRRSTMRRPTGRVALRHGVGLRSLGGAWPRQNSRVRAPPPIPPRASGGAWRFPYPAPTKSCRRSGRDRPVSAECAAARNSGYSGVGPGVVGGCALYAVSTSSPRLGWPETPPIPGPRLPAMVAANLWRCGVPGIVLAWRPPSGDDGARHRPARFLSPSGGARSYVPPDDGSRVLRAGLMSRP
jgi:hypothetical protein